MKLTYQTGIATLIQFILLSFLALASQVVSVVSTCTKDGGNCLGNLITSIIFYLLVAIVFGSIWLLGVAAQERRSKRWALLLIGTEGMIALVSLFSLKLSLHNKGIFGMIASFGIFLLAVWTMTLAYRLMRAEGGRVVRGGQRRRRHTIS